MKVKYLIALYVSARACLAAPLTATPTTTWKIHEVLSHTSSTTGGVTTQHPTETDALEQNLEPRSWTIPWGTWPYVPKDKDDRNENSDGHGQGRIPPEDLENTPPEDGSPALFLPTGAIEEVSERADSGNTWIPMTWATYWPFIPAGAGGAVPQHPDDNEVSMALISSSMASLLGSGKIGITASDGPPVPTLVQSSTLSTSEGPPVLAATTFGDIHQGSSPHSITLTWPTSPWAALTAPNSSATPIEPTMAMNDGLTAHHVLLSSWSIGTLPAPSTDSVRVPISQSTAEVPTTLTTRTTGDASMTTPFTGPPRDSCNNRFCSDDGTSYCMFWAGGTEGPQGPVPGEVMKTLGPCSVSIVKT